MPVNSTRRVRRSCSPFSLSRRHALARAAALGLGALCSMAQAQETYPARPVTLVVPFPPGGVADTVGRPVAEALGRLLGQPVVVENKAGAGGGVGMAQVAKARPDGYTLLMALSSVTIIPEADKILERSPMYQLNQLVPIARFTADPTVLVVRADSPRGRASDARAASCRRSCRSASSPSPSRRPCIVFWTAWSYQCKTIDVYAWE